MNLRRILAVVTARNREFYRDKAGLAWNIMMPVLMVLGFAFIFNQPEENLHKVGVLPHDGQASLAFLQHKHIKFVPIDELDAGVDKVRYHQLDLLLAPGGQTRYWVNELSARGHLAERLLWQSLLGPPDSLHKETVSGRPIRYVDWVLPGVLALNVMFSSLWGVGWVIVRYRKNGVLRRLRATPLTAAEFLTAQILSRLLVTATVTMIVFLGTHMLLDFPMRGSLPALALVFLAGSVSLISLGLAVATRIRNEELADGLLNLISWPMIVLSGIWFSLEGTNIWAQRIAESLPLTHMVDAARRVMLDGAGIADVAFEIGLLAGIGLILLALSSRAFRWQ